MEKLDLHTPDFVSENIEKLASIFPHCVTESADGKKIDFDLLQQELSDDIVEGNRERYRLEWPGKREAIVTANLPTTKTLRPVREDSVDFDTTENLYIEGDNLEVLKLLQESYFGKIKMIYIDPPYNTGNDFVYKDNFSMVNGEWSIVNSEKDEYGTRLVANPESSGRYHSDWLTMMYPRLKLARNLLTDDGVIFISIDDNEVHNLRKVCDEVFGEGNFLTSLCWRRRKTQANLSKFFAPVHDYIFVYCKVFEKLKLNKSQYSQEFIKKTFSNNDNDPKGLYQTGPLARPANSSNKEYILTMPNGRKITAKWSCSQETFDRYVQEGRLIIPKDGFGMPRIKIYLNELEGQIPNTWLDNIASNDDASRQIADIFGSNAYFDFSKPKELIEYLLKIGSNSNSIILDFFSGSATTAHSVMQLNAENGGKRKYIMVQLPELTDKNSEAFKAGYPNICEIGKERIRRAAKLIVNGKWSMLNEKKEKLEKMVNGKLVFVNDKFIFPEGIIIDETAETLLQEINHLQLTINNFDIGFRVYRLADSNMQDVYYRPQDYKQDNLDLFADNIKPDRTADDLLAQVMLDWGLPLSFKIEQDNINGKQVFRVAQDSLLACFDKGIDEDFAKIIAKEKPLRIVFRDSGFANDTAKINVQQLLKQLSPETEMKVI